MQYAQFNNWITLRAQRKTLIKSLNESNGIMTAITKQLFFTKS